MTAHDKQPSPGLVYYPRDQIAWDTLSILKVSSRTNAFDTTESFHRYARLIMHHSTMHMPLLDILNTADELFNKVAERCGTQVVAHTFGLTDWDESAHLPGYPMLSHPSIPDEHELVAEVTIVPDATPITPGHPLYSPMKQTMRQIQEEAIRNNSWHWSDARPEQFVVSPTGDITLVDIEPFILRF